MGREEPRVSWEKVRRGDREESRARRRGERKGVEERLQSKVREGEKKRMKIAVVKSTRVAPNAINR